MTLNLKKIKNKKVLFLQGPMGNYFKKLQLKLNKNNHVFKIGFNKGDQFFSLKSNFYPYKDSPDNWKFFIRNFIRNKKIKIIFLFGDCRFYHKIAIEESKKLDIDIYVFEEGYIRPNYITLEKNGVNFFSQIAKKELDLSNKIFNSRFLKEKYKFSRNKTFVKMALQSFFYYALSNIFCFQYPNYIHHREFSCINEIKYGIVNLFRLFKNKILEINFKKKCLNKLKNKYYFVPLQTHTDSQVIVHSDYESIEEFINEVLISFSKYARQDKYLFFKHHPVDRGRKNYYKTISSLSKELKIDSRVRILYDVHLPSLLKNAVGTIVINSTVGLSSLYHQTPVKCMGKAIYDIEGITAKNISLNNFWNSELEVDSNFYLKFRSYLIKETQINDNFYA
jgi:capsular polysaccharide export protein